ncbi:interleukin-13 receptor subunit alpha-2-like isoform X1 [Scleropages formosus]|uniref:Interleukin 13 receptor, alpha 2 n=1 Tax=Scleropages formosus TaxID=113540 RepID=A0A8C9R369_SCLFO|nr:interleukin-13 receptor subunit alpha-2-like isoform X1 [Scleropages formosus]
MALEVDDTRIVCVLVRKKMKHKLTVDFLAGLFLLVNFNVCSTSAEITVDPPADLRVTDPGHLGHLHISWARPSSLENVTDCSVRFELQYFNTYEDRWTVIRTVRLKYSTHFDLEKDVHVKVWTLLRGPCVNNTELQSPPAEVILQPPDKGTSPRVSGFTCVFYQKEFMDCTWEARGGEASQAQDHLFYWHSEMGQAMECPEYIESDGFRTGCRFPKEVLEEFTDFNICVNGTSAAGPMRAAYFTLQIQNHVKPATVETLSLDALPNGNTLLTWSPPGGKIPNHCLEFEVESKEDGVLGENLHKYITRETSYTSAVQGQPKTSCFRVRSRVHQFCADKSFWSEWSHQRCLAESTKKDVSAMKVGQVCVLALCAVTLFAFPLYLWNCKRKVKNQEWFLSSSFTKWGLLGCNQGLSPPSVEKLIHHLSQDEVQPFKQGQAV